jgi:DnaJ-class molecular chaperone
MSACRNCGGSGHFRTYKGWVPCLACNGTGTRFLDAVLRPLLPMI